MAQMSTGESYCPEAGDLIWIDFDPTVGHEQRGHRPAYVLTDKSYNSRSGLCIVCPITSRTRGYPFEVAIPDRLDITIRGAILADQARSVSWEHRYVKAIEPAPFLLTDVRERLAALLGIE